MSGPRDNQLPPGAALYERILEAVPGGVVHVGPSGEILLANQPAQEFLGLSYDKLTNRYIVDFSGETYHDDGSHCGVDDYPVTRCLVTGEPQGPTVIGVRQPTGEVRWALFTALPFDAGDGTGAVVSFVDITARKEAEQEVRRLEAELVLRDRLATVGTLAAAIAHEVNNPLAYILLSLEMADEKLEQAELDGCELLSGVRENLSDAANGARRVRDIVRELMSFSRVQEAPPTAVDVHAAIDAAIKMATPELRYRAQLVRDFGDIPPIFGIEGRISQVFLNLLLNAARAFAEKSPTNRVSITTREVDGQVVIDVADNGRGMKPEDAQRIFEPFFTTSPEGSGLGLPISRSLVEGAGGSLDVLSTSTQGTTFRVVLPAARQLRVAERKPVPTPLSRGPRRRILVADDEMLVLKAITKTMDEDWEVVAVGSVAEAKTALAGDDAFDVILCDTMMLDGTGPEVFLWTKQHLPDLVPRFVLMTGGTFTDEVRAFMDEVRVPVLPKPFGRNELLQVLADLQEALAPMPVS